MSKDGTGVKLESSLESEVMTFFEAFGFQLLLTMQFDKVNHHSLVVHVIPIYRCAKKSLTLAESKK